MDKKINRRTVLHSIGMVSFLGIEVTKVSANKNDDFENTRSSNHSIPYDFALINNSPDDLEISISAVPETGSQPSYGTSHQLNGLTDSNLGRDENIVKWNLTKWTRGRHELRVSLSNGKETIENIFFNEVGISDSRAIQIEISHSGTVEVFNVIE